MSYGLGELLPAGSIARVGFGIGRDLAQGSSVTEVEQALEVCLYNAGQQMFSEINVTLTEGWLTDYVTIRVRTRADFGNVPDFSGFAEQSIRRCFPSVSISSRDPVIYEYDPQGNPTGYDPSARQPIPAGGGNPDGTGRTPTCPHPPSAVCACGYEWRWNWLNSGCTPIGYVPPQSNSSFIDDLAASLGVGASTAALLGVGLAIGGVILLKRII
jgi:hypothetical protein